MQQCLYSFHFVDAAAGASIDWAKGVAGIKYSFTPELRGEDDEGNWYGFVAPPSEIEPCGWEMWAGVRAMLDRVLEKETEAKKY